MGLRALTGLGLDAGRRWGLPAWLRLVLGLLLLLTTLPSVPASSQVGPGASLTVVRGSVAVTRPDGTAIYPAGTGLTLAIGDIVGTLERTRAIVTFFSGIEVELGSNTTIVIRRLDRGLLEEAQIGVENVIGLTVIRVPGGALPGSAVEVVSGNTIAMVRSGEVGHGVDPSSNNVTVACVDGAERCVPEAVTFPDGSRPLLRQTARTVTGRGDVIEERVPPGTSVWDALAAGGGLDRQSGIESRRGTTDQSDTPNFSADGPTSTATLSPTATVTVTSTTTPTITTTATPSATLTRTATATPSATATPTRTSTATPTATAPAGTPGPTCGTQRNAPGGMGTFTTVHSVGRNSGTFLFEWDADFNPDTFRVFYEGVEIFDTGEVSFTGSQNVSFGPGASTFVTVEVETGPGSFLWAYTVNCVP
jgi:hypothetical protein